MTRDDIMSAPSVAADRRSTFFNLAATNALAQAAALKNCDAPVIRVATCPLCGGDTLTDTDRADSSRCVSCGWAAGR